jgi:hypothetical protein
VIRKTDEHGGISTFAGNGTPGYKGDGGAATKAELNKPTGVGVDQSANVFISDTPNQVIRKVSASDGTINTYAGNGTMGFKGDGGPALSAELCNPTGQMSMDGTALYFADTCNNRVRGVFTGPPPVLPESVLMILLPISAAALLGGGALIIRRLRRQRISSGAMAA